MGVKSPAPPLMGALALSEFEGDLVVHQFEFGNCARPMFALMGALRDGSRWLPPQGRGQ